MSTTQQREQDADLQRHKGEVLSALISEQIIHRLGEPDGLYAVHVRELWEDHYRVNVLTGENAVSARIASSYFVEADSDGNIIKSNPQLTRVGPVH